MTVRHWTLSCGLAALLAASFLTYVRFNREVSLGPARNSGGLEAISNAPGQANRKASAPIDPVIRIDVTKVLGSVNGKELKLADLLPLNPTQKNQVQEFSEATYNYLLDRAINRELVLQTAKGKGIALDDSQREQLAEFRKQRNQQEPGLVQHLNAGENQIDFEVRDAEAFMLQTALLAKTGVSPDVTAEETAEYYRQHSAEYPELLVDEPARSRVWANIDFQIRSNLALAKRANFQSQLSAYMDQVRSGANIALAPINQSDLSSLNSSVP